MFGAIISETPLVEIGHFACGMLSFSGNFNFGGRFGRLGMEAVEIAHFAYGPAAQVRPVRTWT